MNLSETVKKILYLSVGLALLLTACSKKSTNPQPPSLQITHFAVTPTDFTPGDTLALSYTVTGADSAILNPPGTRLANASSGTVKVVPHQAVKYRLVAFRGTDSVSAAASIGIRLAIPNGLYYKGVIDSSRLAPVLAFKVTDSLNAIMTKPWLHFALPSGDGLLSADSLRPNDSGMVRPTYKFSDSLGHAVIRATIPGFDTVDVNLRADILTPGPHGQGQYVSLDDNYNTVKILNGQPVSVDVDPFYWITYANYESTMGVVVEIDDANHNSTADSAEGVLGVIVTTIYPGKTHEGIRIGSAYHDVVAAYGQPDSLRYDPTPPAAIIIKYMHRGLIFVGVPADTSIEQIEVSEFVTASPGLKQGSGRISAESPAMDLLPRVRTRR